MANRDKTDFPATIEWIIERTQTYMKTADDRLPSAQVDVWRASADFAGFQLRTPADPHDLDKALWQIARFMNPDILTYTVDTWRVGQDTRHNGEEWVANEGVEDNPTPGSMAYAYLHKTEDADLVFEAVCTWIWDDDGHLAFIDMPYKRRDGEVVWDECEIFSLNRHTQHDYGWAPGTTSAALEEGHLPVHHHTHADTTYAMMIPPMAQESEIQVSATTPGGTEIKWTDATGSLLQNLSYDGATELDIVQYALDCFAVPYVARGLKANVLLGAYDEVQAMIYEKVWAQIAGTDAKMFKKNKNGEWPMEMLDYVNFHDETKMNFAPPKLASCDNCGVQIFRNPRGVWMSMESNTASCFGTYITHEPKDE